MREYTDSVLWESDTNCDKWNHMVQLTYMYLIIGIDLYNMHNAYIELENLKEVSPFIRKYRNLFPNRFNSDISYKVSENCL